MSEHVSRSLVCDQCAAVAGVDQPMICLRINLMTSAGYTAVPGGTEDQHACSMECARLLLEGFGRGKHRLPDARLGRGIVPCEAP